MFTTRRRLTFGTDPGAFIGPDGMARSALRRQRPIVQTIGTQASALGDALVREATVLNDYGTPTFTRASTAYDPYNLTTAISGARRRRLMPISRTLSVNADLIEGARTNLCLQSQTFDNASWGKTDMTVTADAAVAPDGTTTADLVTEGSANTAAMSQSVTITAASVVVFQVVVKASAVVDWVRVQVASNGNANGFRAWFSTAAGTATAGTTLGTGSAITSGIDSLGNGYYRCWIVGKVDAAAIAATILVCSAANNASATRVNAAAYYLWAAQIEQMAASSTTGFPSSYIATTSATVTRAADALSVAYVLGQIGTILALCVPYGWTGDQDGVSTWTIARANDANASRMERASATAASMNRADGAGVEAGAATHGLTANTLRHLAMTWDSSAVSPYINGVLFTPDTTLTPPYQTNTTLNIGANAGTNAFFGWVGLLAYTRTLSASELYALYAQYSTAA